MTTEDYRTGLAQERHDAPAYDRPAYVATAAGDLVDAIRRNSTLGAHDILDTAVWIDGSDLVREVVTAAMADVASEPMIAAHVAVVTRTICASIGVTL